MVPPSPVTLFVEGYGVAVPSVGIVMVAALVTDLVPAASRLTNNWKLLLTVTWPSLTLNQIMVEPI